MELFGVIQVSFNWYMHFIRFKEKHAVQQA